MSNPDSSGVFGLLTFDPPIYCTRDALGASAELSVSSVAGKITLPSLPEWGSNPLDPLRMPLIAPTAAAGWKRGSPCYWGHPTSYPSGFGHVELALLQFEVHDSQRRSAGTSILQGIDAWRTLFTDHLELITRQRSGPSFEVHRRTSDFHLFYWTGGKAASDFDKQPIKITTYLQSNEVALTSAQLQVICGLASSGTALPLEYRVLLESYRANARSDYRTAVIHGATATEIALTNAIRAKLAAEGTVYAQKLLTKFRMLAGRLELASIVGVALPNLDYQRDLVQPRNDVVHKADAASLSIARAAINVADAVVDAQASALYAGRIYPFYKDVPGSAPEADIASLSTSPNCPH